MPLSPGHLLLTTRAHHEKVSEVDPGEAAELGMWLPVLSRVLANVTGVWDWNIVQNNGMLYPFCPITHLLCIYTACLATICIYADRNATGAAAAQVVPHVHFHIIPRPALTPELRNRSFTMFGKGQRSELDDDEADALSKRLREELAIELKRMENRPTANL